MKLSPQYDGITLQLKNGFRQLSCQLSSFFTSSYQRLSYDCRWASSLAAFYLAGCFADQGRRYTGRWDSCWNELGVFVVWPLKFNIEQPSIVPSSCLRQWAQIHQHHYVHNSLQQDTGLCDPSVWRYEKKNITIWGYCGEFLFCWLKRCQLDIMHFDALGVNVGNVCLHWPPPSCPPSSGHCACFSCITSSTCSFHHQVSDFHWCFLEKPQTMVAAPSRGSFIFDQAESMRFAVSASAPAAVPTAATKIIVFTLKDDWLAPVGSLSFQGWMQGENSRFFIWGCKPWSHTLLCGAVWVGMWYSRIHYKILYQYDKWSHLWCPSLWELKLDYGISSSIQNFIQDAITHPWPIINGS